MAIHDYLIDNQTGLNFRSDINNALLAIVSNNSNPTEPTEIFAFMFWMDTTTGILKLRNSSNTDWVNVLNLATGASVSMAIDDLTDASSDGLNNLALGLSALLVNTTGSDNVAVGIAALLNNDTGSANVAVGKEALAGNTTGLNNTALGKEALKGNTTGFNNTAVGMEVLLLNTTGSDNTAVGRAALSVNVSGNYNIALGKAALMLNTTGSNNIAVGKDALLINTTGLVNVAVGNYALTGNTTGSNNVAIGVDALVANIVGNYNTAVGQFALNSNTSNNNTAIGRGALNTNITGSNNTALGFGTFNSSNSDSYAITLGYATQGIGTDYFTMGKDTGSNRVYNQFTANATWIRASDERIKKDIRTNEDCGLGFINDLRTVHYKFKAPNELDPSLSEYDKDNDKPSHDKRMYGFIAQEVKEALDNHNITNFAGWHQIDDGKDKMQGISYEMFVMPLVKSVQELSTKSDDLIRGVVDVNTKAIELYAKNHQLVIENQDLSDRIDEQNATIDAMMLRIDILENKL